MAWRSRSSPLFHPGHVQWHQRRGLGRAYGFKVMTVQEHADEAFVGEDMMDNTGDETDPPIMAPMALVNNRHFWGGRGIH